MANPWVGRVEEVLPRWPIARMSQKDVVFGASSATRTPIAMRSVPDMPSYALYGAELAAASGS